jgi:small subunit ribosomal protein S16
MAVKIRLARAGAKHRAYYRIIAADARSPSNGRFLERLGTYDPRTDPPTVAISRDRLERWLAFGACPSRTVARLLRQGPPA